MGQLGWGVLFGVLVTQACGNNSDDTPIRGGPGIGTGGGKGAVFGGGAGKGTGGGAGQSAGEGGMAGAGDTTSSGGHGGTAGSTGTSDPGAPTVHVTSPAGVTDPNSADVIVADELDALCTATKSTARGATAVDPSTVLLEMLDADGKVVETNPGTPTDNEDEYTAHFITGKVTDNGVISFACQASDSSETPLVGFDQIDSFVDHGPAITPVDPPAGDASAPPFATAVDQALHVAFTVAEAPVAKGDKGARLGDIALTVGGKSFDLTESNGEYTATVHLDDPKVFSPTPDGDQKIVITAADVRSPKAASSEVDYDFIVDGTGPDITIVSPQPGQVKSGKVQFVIQITDTQSGVDPLSVVVTINNNDYRYSPTDDSWSYDSGSGTFTFSFDTTQIEDSVAQATLQVVALDLVGNKSTQSVLLQLDNVPPIVELDPLPIREQNRDTGDCSLAFDPVGPDAASDLDVVYDFQVFRAFAWEETNHARGETSDLAAGIDLNSVVLVLQPKPEQGLLMDTNGDGICDQLATQDTDTGADLHSLQLHPVSPQGNSWFGAAGSEDATLLSEFPMPTGCTYQGTATPPPYLCPPANSSDMRRIVSWDVDHTVPVVFGVDPLTGLSCTGYGWEIGPLISEGWICAAATAKDNNGNVGISVPLRLCYDDGVDPPPNCRGVDAVPPPSCVVDSCVLPPRFGLAVLGL
jgi:hypothetical protein